jgi:valyl-tRNA synthetase
MRMREKFHSQAIERRIYEQWEKSSAFSCAPSSHKPAFCIMMPPPNVTGTLHIGHALNYTLQDILVRYKRMKGFDVLWQPGTDHAGIATQVVVERQLHQQGLDRRTVGREKFLEKVWAWKEESGNIIVKQQRRLGISPDWGRQRFTLDEGLSRAVRKVFVTLYREGLIYRDKRLVNWDPQVLTALSDLEVKWVETKGHYWYFRYPVVGGHDTFITIATSRPETLFGDTAVAVNPEDPRYQHLIGQFVELPLSGGRRIPIIADAYSDPEKGSGAVKITPAHDFNDFEVAQRHHLACLNIFTADAHLNENVPVAYQGLERLVARQRVVEEMAQLGLLEKVEEATLMLPYSERSDVVIEPYLTDQWFVRMDVLAQPALEAVENGQIELLPNSAKAVYDHWLTHIQPWCISRQLWWGHRIPAWYAPDGTIIVAESEEEAYQQAHQQFGTTVELKQDEDVLDTWFSSGLWPFSTLGWPEQTPELQRYYPSSVLISGSDILFFWVARMIMLGLKFMKDVPFRTVYLHALVRDGRGQKMSKSKGNILDPLELIETYGADALRFTMAALATPGRDIRFSTHMVETYRNFVTKFWNTAQFCEHYGCLYPEHFNPAHLTGVANRWIVSEFSQVINNLEKALELYSFDQAANQLYQFIWGRFCDWYLEMIKPVLSGSASTEKTEAQATVAWLLGYLCHVLHPFMPFITEAIWQHLTAGTRSMLISAAWPSLNGWQDPGACQEISWLIEVIGAIRGLRSELGIPPSTPVKICFGEGKEFHRTYLHVHQPILEKLARVSEVRDLSSMVTAQPISGAAQLVVDGSVLMVPLGEILDLGAERQRLQKALKEVEDGIYQLQSKLSNPEFTTKAPLEVVEKNQRRLQEMQEQHAKLRNAIKRIMV